MSNFYFNLHKLITNYQNHWNSSPNLFPNYTNRSIIRFFLALYLNYFKNENNLNNIVNWNYNLPLIYLKIILNRYFYIKLKYIYIYYYISYYLNLIGLNLLYNLNYFGRILAIQKYLFLICCLFYFSEIGAKKTF